MANKAVWRGERRSFYAVGQNESKPYWISNERQDCQLCLNMSLMTINVLNALFNAAHS